MSIPSKDEILEALKPVQDPEIRIGVVDLGLVYDIVVDDSGQVEIKMTLTTPACPYGEMLVAQIHRAAEELPGVTGVKVVLVWDPVWDPTEMASDLAKDLLGIW
ncbi:MAG: metal-sulfur cluster assembly factor [Candidatus Zixiibacteriota bacterium]